MNNMLAFIMTCGMAWSGVTFAFCLLIFGTSTVLDFHVATVHPALGALYDKWRPTNEANDEHTILTF